MFIAVITGIGGDERFLARPEETYDPKRADRFTTPSAALEAADAHINAFPSCIARNMRVRIEPDRRAR